MTAETLKPFIASGPTYGKTKRNANLITICLASALSIVCMSLLGFMIWNSIRIAELETEVSSLKKVIDNMHKRLGFDYFDDINEFADAYSNNLLDDVENKDVLDGLEDDLDGEMDPDDLGSGEYEYDDDLYDDEDDEDKINDDFGRFLDEKQSFRRQRSISTNDLHGEKSSENKDNKISYQHHSIDDSNERPPIVSHSSVSEKKYFDSPDTVRDSTMENHKIMPQKAVKFNRHGKHRRTFRKIGNQGHVERQRRARQRPVAVQFTLKNDVENASLIAIGEPASWAKTMSMDKFFKSNQQQIKISLSGLYYVYAQLSFKTPPSGGLKVYQNSIPFLKCINSVGAIPTDLTCFTSGITYLEKDDNIHLKNAVGVSFDDQSSFIGLIKLGNERVTIDTNLF